jgi:hypothetical protein
MAKSRVQINRSNVSQQRPTAGTRDPGELYINWADRQIGTMDAAKAPMDLVAIRFFTEAASYLVDDVVLRAGYAYRAITPSDPGPFVPANWQIMGALIEAPIDGSSYLRKDGDWVKLLDVDGATSSLDADLLDGQHGAYYQALANTTGTISDAQHGNRAGGALHALATGSVAGFMSGADKTKIDTVQAGATDDMTPAELLTAIKTVDGAASALDADLLDGQHGAYYQDLANATGSLPAARFDDTAHGNRAGGTLHPAVTASVNGFMVAADKAKLDGFAAGSTYAPIASPTFTGDPKAPNPATSDNDTSIATTSYVKAQGYITDAVSDGLTYGRKNAAWATIVGGAVVSDSAPGAPLQNGQLWYETDTGNTYVWVVDADSSQWVQQNVMPSGGAGDNLSTAADMSIGFRTSGNRFVVNNAADMSGTDVVTVGETGGITSNVGYFIGAPGGVNLCAGATSGNIYLRPNGAGSDVGRATIASTGDMSVGGIVTASGSLTSTSGQMTAGGGYFIGSPTWTIIGPAAGGTPSGVVLRPTAYNSTTGETLISPAGVMTVGNNVIVDTSFRSSTTTAVLATSAAGSLYLRPNGHLSTTGQMYLSASGMATFVAATAPGSITSDAYVAGGTFAGSAFGNSGNGVLNRNDGCCLHKSAGNAAFTVAAFFNNAVIGSSGGSQVGAITTTGSSTAYATSSDELLKDFIGVYDPQKAIDIIRADPVRDFNWKNGDGYAVGWGAQTSHAVSPDLAQPPPEPSPAEIEALEGKEPPKAGEDGYVPWGMDQSKRTPYLWAALSAALDKIDQLEARIAALEGGA